MDRSHLLSDPELRRFANQISLPQVGIEGQEKIKNAKIAVVGAGGLGTIVLQYLAAIGVGHLEIIDFALVQETDIQRQILYGGNDLGKLKTIISKQNLQNLFPLVHFEITNIQLTSINATKILKQFSYVVDTSNNDETHRIIKVACEETEKPWVFGAVNGFKGQVSVINKGKDLQNLLRTSNPTNGATSLTYGLIGNLMAFETFKLITEHENVLVNKLLLVDLLSYQFEVKAF